MLEKVENHWSSDPEVHGSSPNIENFLFFYFFGTLSYFMMENVGKSEKSLV